MANPQVLTMGMDLYALGYVSEIAKINEKKTFKKDKLIINSYSIIANNFDNFFSIDNPASPFHNSYWRYENLQVINEDKMTIWNGVLSDFIRNPVNKTVKIESQDIIQKYRKEKVVYESSDWETGADAAKNVMDVIEYTGYNNASLQKSIAYLTSNSCYLKCNINKSDNQTLIQFLDKIALYSCADCYLHNNNIYFKTWQPFTGSTNIDIKNDDIIKITDIRSSDKEMVNDYSIGYNADAGTPATDFNSNNLGAVSRKKYGTHELRELRSNTGKQIVYKDKTSATFTGENYIKRTTKNYLTQPAPLTAIKGQFDYSLKDWINLETYFKLIFEDELWDEKIFEIFEFTRDENKKELFFMAYEVI